MGFAALSNADVAREILLSQEQQDKIKSINTEYAAKRNVMYTGSCVDRVEPMGFAKMQMQNREQDREREAKIADVLTKDQLDKFASLKSKKFNLSQLIAVGGIGNGGRPSRIQPEFQ